jgi:hypothetical protein
MFRGHSCASLWEFLDGIFILRTYRASIGIRCCDLSLTKHLGLSRLQQFPGSENASDDGKLQKILSEGFESGVRRRWRRGIRSVIVDLILTHQCIITLEILR